MAGPTNPTAVLFTAVTKFADGSNVPNGGIAKYQYGFGTASGAYTRIVDDTDFAPSSGKQIGAIPTDLAEGQWYVSARAVSVGGGVAPWGNELPFTVQRVPAAIADLSFSG